MVRRLLVCLLVVAGLPVAAAAASSAAASGLPVPGDRLTVTVSGTGGADAVFSLGCRPVGGDHPRAQDACARLDELAAEGADPFVPVPADAICTMQYGGPGTARVTGIWQGRSIDAAFSRVNGCEIARWDAMGAVLPAARA